MMGHQIYEAQMQRQADARAEAKYALAAKKRSPAKSKARGTSKSKARKRSASPAKKRSPAKSKARKRSASPAKKRSPAKSKAKARSASPAKVRIVLKKDDVLKRHGYADTAKMSVEQRRAALLGAIGEFGTTHVARRLNVLAIYSRNKNPLQAAIFEADKQWVRLFALVRPGAGPSADNAAYVSTRFDAGNRAPVRRR